MVRGTDVVPRSLDAIGVGGGSPSRRRHRDRAEVSDGLPSALVPSGFFPQREAVAGSTDVMPTVPGSRYRRTTCNAGLPPVGVSFSVSWSRAARMGSSAVASIGWAAMSSRTASPHRFRRSSILPNVAASGNPSAVQVVLVSVNCRRTAGTRRPKVSSSRTLAPAVYGEGLSTPPPPTPPPPTKQHTRPSRRPPAARTQRWRLRSQTGLIRFRPKMRRTWCAPTKAGSSLRARAMAAIASTPPGA